jgi:hypothetical protein
VQRADEAASVDELGRERTSHQLRSCAFPARPARDRVAGPLRQMLGTFIDALMPAEADAVCGAA